MEREEFLKVYRHSMAHILAKAVIEIFGKDNVQYAIGPEIADGMYYDFLLPRGISEDDFQAIEDKMREIIKRREDWTVAQVSKEEALSIFKDQKFKVELINDMPEDEIITTYKTGDDFIDLCRGPHIANSQELMNVAFQIKSVSGSYWKGDEHRDQLQRIYVYVFPDKKQLKEQWKETTRNWGHSLTYLCLMRLHQVCHIGCQEVGRCLILCLIGGDVFMRFMDIRRFLHQLSIAKSSG